MNTPPLLLAAAIVLWGWLGDTLPVAIPVALVLEGARFARGRVVLTQRQQFRVADACTLAAIAAGIAFAATAGFPRAAVLFFQWLPLALLPLALMQAYGAEHETDLRVLFWSMRRQVLREPARINLGYPYLVLWVVAASAVPGRGVAFDAALAILVPWALWPHRPDGRRRAAWVALAAFAVALGASSAVGLRGLQLWLEGAAAEWLGGGGAKVNPYRSVTDIGRLGELKMSDSIVLRVRGEADLRVPLLLHHASYVSYQGASWIARGGAFSEVPAEAPGRWRVGEGEPGRVLAILEDAPHGDPVLALPAGAVRVWGGGLRSLRGNALGAVQGRSPPGFVEYRVGIDASGADRRAPTGLDLQLPARERPAIERVARSWGLPGLGPAAAVDAVRRRFFADFRYATFQEAAASGHTPVGDFLERTRAGHCEHFATATALLLRAAGVPARYATGYSLQEWSGLEGAWIARERHAHAWVRAWVDGRWIDVDTTPPTWAGIESEARPAWSGLLDAWSWARVRALRWHTEAGTAQRALAYGAPLLLLTAWLAWRLGRRWKPAPRAAATGDGAGPPDDFAGSEFARVARRLESRGFPRRPAETCREWLARLDPAVVRPAEAAELLSFHYRHRFDPRGLDPRERDAFAAAVDRWLDRAGTLLEPRGGRAGA